MSEAQLLKEMKQLMKEIKQLKIISKSGTMNKTYLATSELVK